MNRVIAVNYGLQGIAINFTNHIPSIIPSDFKSIILTSFVI
jgi:hypothetical protein